MVKQTDDIEISFANLFGAVGMAMHQWALVEESLFILFEKIIRAPTEEMASIVFYSSPSFESKKVLVDRLAHCVLDEDDKKTWAEIVNTLTDEGQFRGQIAHYRLESRISNRDAVMKAMLNGEEPVFEFEEPVLGRSKKNQLRISKKTKNKTLISATTMKDIMSHCSSFHDVGERLDSLAELVSKKYPHPIVEGLNLSQAHGLAPMMRLE